MDEKGTKLNPEKRIISAWNLFFCETCRKRANALWSEERKLIGKVCGFTGMQLLCMRTDALEIVRH